MKITRPADAPEQPFEADTFSAPVTRRDYGPIESPEGTALLVRFPAGARTHWHSQPTGQVVYVDGGATANDLLMQFQADVLGVPVIRPLVAETTSLGAAYAAGLAVGFWSEVEDLRANWGKDKQWEPKLDKAEVEKEYAQWKKAVTRTFDWVD